MATPSLPAPPRALAAILSAASDPDVRLEDLSHLVSTDPAFAGLILQVANTARNGGAKAGSITVLSQATMRLGVRAVRNYALCHAARSCTSSRRLEGFDLDQFWEDSVRRAVAAEVIGEWVEEVASTEAFTVGLLMELGVVALIMQSPEKAEAWNEIRHAEPARRLAQERALFGATHTEVNAGLAKDWQLPTELAVPLMFHHRTEDAPANLRKSCELACAAETLALLMSAEDKRGALERAQSELSAFFGLSEEDVKGIVDSLGERMQEVGRAMGIKVGPQPKLQDILEEANRSLVEANLTYEEVVRKLERLIAEKEALAAALDQRNRELEHLSVTDALTQLPNRRCLFSRLHEEVHRVARHGGRVAMLVADIDHFKSVNDTWGHVFGDVVLRQVAERLQDSVRTTDIVARAGGEEFAALLPETSLQGASALAHRMLAQVARLVLRPPSGDQVRVTVSIGVSWIEGPHLGPFDADTVATSLYSAADDALYASKEGGRNRVTVVSAPTPWVVPAQAR